MALMQCGLHGKLEELGLDEILQIVGVSRRTGILTLRSRGREAVLHIRDGLLVRASSTGFQQSLGELLVRSGAVTQDVVQQALVIQQQERFRERIGSILIHRFNVDLQVVEKAVREQINNVLLTLFAWTEGSFDCTACDVETVDAAFLDPVQLLLEMGDPDADQLAAAGIKLQQELGVKDLVEADEVAEEPPSVAVASVLPALVVVDDDGVLGSAVVEGLAGQFAGSFFTGSEPALQKVDALYKIGDSPVVLVDLIMPKMDGTGVLGGLELLQLLKVNFKGLRLVAMSDFRHEDAIRQIEELDCRFLEKPRRGEVSGSAFDQFMAALRETLNS